MALSDDEITGIAEQVSKGLAKKGCATCADKSHAVHHLMLKEEVVPVVNGFKKAVRKLLIYGLLALVVFAGIMTISFFNLEKIKGIFNV